MKQTLEELWYGNVRPFAQVRTSSPEMDALLQKMEKCREALCETLNEEQKESLRIYDDIVDEIHAICERDVFIHGFRLGAKLIHESLCEKEL